MTMSKVYSIFMIILCLQLCLTTGKRINNTKIPKTFIISVQNELKPNSIIDIKDWYKSILSSTNTNHEFLHVYTNAFHGFSIQLTPIQLKALESRPEVLAVFPDEIYQLHTTRTPHFLGLDSYHKPFGLLNESFTGSNVVIGVLDTGVSPTSMSFDDTGLGPVPAHFKGECDWGEEFLTNICNRKIIGVRYFSAGYRVINGHIGNTAIDHDGHGTHTASTMAGRTRENASFFEYAKGEATGIAPGSRLAIYKVCWEMACVISDILAGIDKAVEDGVDIISMSLGGPAQRYSVDPLAIATFASIGKGVFVSASAGNEGPFPGSVSNHAPWVTTVGASTIDRTFPAILMLGNVENLTGASIFTGAPLPKGKMYPLVHLNSSFGMSHCLPNSLNENDVKGKIVVCLRGEHEVEMSITVQKAGGVGIVVTSGTMADSDGQISYPHMIPGLKLSIDSSIKLLSYISKTQLNATIISRGTVIGEKPAPVVADFSSRGPNIESIYVLKPDVIAPGVDILAAWPDFVSPSKMLDDPRRSEFNIISGTSMSCPHVSGVAALLKGSHPDWTPAMMRSAMMTTAYKGYHEAERSSEQRYGSGVSPWDIGAGHVDPKRANDPGLVFDIALEDYIRFLCASNFTENEMKTIVKQPVTYEKESGNPWDLNYPAIIVRSDQETVVNRTSTNVDTSASSYTVKVMQPEGAYVTVDPMELRFETKGNKQSFSVKVTPMKTSVQHQKAGLIMWTDGKHNVTIPLIVYVAKHEKLAV